MKFDAKKEYQLYEDKMAQATKAQNVSEVGPGHQKTLNCLMNCVKWVLDITECKIADNHFSHETTNIQMDP